MMINIFTSAAPMTEKQNMGSNSKHTTTIERSPSKSPIAPFSKKV